MSRDVLTLSISDGLETSRFKTNNIIKVTITPSSRNQISGVANSGIGNLVVGPGFVARMFTVSSKGSGNTYVFGLNTQKARVVSMVWVTVGLAALRAIPPLLCMADPGEQIQEVIPCSRW